MQYEEVLKMIQESEKRVDEVLKAAKLERREKEPMSIERLHILVDAALAALMMLTAFGCFFALFYLCR